MTTSSSDSINQEIKKVRVSRFDQGPKNDTNSDIISPIASTSTLPSLNGLIKSDTNGHYSKNSSAESYRFTSSTSRTGDKPPSPTFTRTSYIPSRDNNPTSYIPTSSNRDDPPSSSRNSNSFSNETTRISPTSQRIVVPPPPSNYFLPTPSMSQNSLDFAPRIKKPRPIQPTLSTNLTTTTITTTTTTTNSNSSNSSSRPSPSLSDSISLPTAIPTGPRKPTVYALGPRQLAQNSYIPNGSRQSESQQRPSTDTTRRSNSIPSSYTVSSVSIPPPPPLASIPPDYYKPKGTKDFIVTYDQTLDFEAVKKGAKELVYRYDGEGIETLPTDPRKNTDRSTLEKLSKAKERLVLEPSRLKYNWDKNSTGPPPPPPPSAILVTGFPGSTTHNDIHRHFSSYGKISTVDTKADPKTGGSLGICWISFIDDKPRGRESDTKAAKEKYDRESRTGSAQDGHAVAQQAIMRGNGSKIGARMMSSNDVVKVVMDGEGLLTKAAVELEILRRKLPTSVPTPVAPTPPPYQPPPPPPPVDLPPRPSPSNFASAYSPPIFIPSPFNNNPLKPLPLPFKPNPYNNNPSAPHSNYNNRFPPDFPSNPTQYNNGYGSNIQRNGNNSLPPPPISLPLPPPPFDNRQSTSQYDSRPPLPPSSSHHSNNTPSGPRSHLLPAHLHPDFASMTPHAKAMATGRPLPTDPYIPIVFAGQHHPTPAPYVPIASNRPPPIPPANRYNSSYKSSNGREPTKMSEAVANAVLAAKRRLYHSTAKKNLQPKVDNGEADMELESDDSQGNSDEDNARDEEKLRKIDDQIFFHRDGRVEPRKVLAKGQAPAAAIAWQASPQVLKSKLLDNGKPYLFIHKSTFYDAREFGTTVLSGGDLEGHFKAYALDRTYADSNGWYITFTNSSLARQAHDTLNGKPFAGAPLELTYFDAPPEVQRSPEVTLALEKVRAMVLAPTPQIGAPIPPPKVKKLAGWTDSELIEEAKEIVINDLLAAFKNDLKNRVVSGKIWENLAKWESGGSKTTASSSGTGTQAKEVKSLSSLPSFSKKKPQVERPPPGFVAIVQRFDSEAPSDSIGYASDGRDDHSDSTTRTEKHSSSTQVRKAQVSKKKKKTIKIQSGSEDEESESIDISHAKLSKKQQGKKPAKVKIEMTYTSSEAEESDNELVVSTVPIENSAPTSTNKSPSVEAEEESLYENIIEETIKIEDDTLPLKKKRGRPVGWRKPVVLVDGELPRVPVKKHSLTQQQQQYTNQFDSDRETESDQNSQFSKPAKLNKVLKKPYHKLIAQSPPPIFASPTPPPVPRPAFIFTQPDGPVPDPFETGVAADEEDLFYLKLAIERPRIGMSLHPTPPQSEDEFTPDSITNNTRHPTGSARTEGYYPISVAEKIANRAPTNRAKAAHDASTTTGAGSGVAVSRLARANTRGLVRGMELHKKVMDSDTDVLKFNQLRTRKKQLTFSRSGIEGYGLFAMEHIPVGEMVIEYVGELVRQQVADRREKAYERQGIGSSYLFRVDEDLVVDATKKGNLGRLINHCCAPNCTARIITINGVKKIVIYAKTNIEPGDEVTYDYHFPHEDVKIPCLCAHPLCRKYLN